MSHDTQLPEYIFFPSVRAGRIVKIEPPALVGARMWHLYLEGKTPGSFVLQPVVVDYIKRHQPEVGGYFVREADGYTNYRSAEAFDAHYARMPDPKPVTMLELDLRAQQAPTFTAAGIVTSGAGQPVTADDVIKYAAGCQGEQG